MFHSLWRNEVTIPCPQTTAFEEKGEPKQTQTNVSICLFASGLTAELKRLTAFSSLPTCPSHFDCIFYHKWSYKAGDRWYMHIFKYLFTQNCIKYLVMCFCYIIWWVFFSRFASCWLVCAMTFSVLAPSDVQ